MYVPIQQTETHVFGTELVCGRFLLALHQRGVLAFPEPHLVHDRDLQAELQGGTVEHVLLVRLGGDEAVDLDRLLLTDAVHTRLCLTEGDNRKITKLTTSATSLGAPWPPLYPITQTCKSFCGFQSESKMMTVSAAVRLMPKPPARVDNNIMNASDEGLVNRSIAACVTAIEKVETNV